MESATMPRAAVIVPRGRLSESGGVAVSRNFDVPLFPGGMLQLLRDSGVFFGHANVKNLAVLSYENRH